MDGNQQRPVDHGYWRGIRDRQRTYHYRVKSKDAADNPAMSGDFTFTFVIPLAPTTLGVPLQKWSDPSVPIIWRLNPAKGNNVTGSPGLADVFRSAFQAWSGVNTARVSFEEGPTTSITDAAFDQVNLISLLPANYNSGALSLTVLYSFSQAGTDQFGRKIEFPGQIVEADILFNPTVLFSTDLTMPADRVDLRSRAVHEVGHLLGLDHSGLLSSVMFPNLVAGTGNFRALSKADVTALSTIYPTSAFFDLGGLRGTVRTDSGSPVFGAHVVIVDDSGQPVASTITDPDGDYCYAAH